jgi:hypothetical protein
VLAGKKKNSSMYGLNLQLKVPLVTAVYKVVAALKKQAMAKDVKALLLQVSHHLEA